MISSFRIEMAFLGTASIINLVGLLRYVWTAPCVGFGQNLQLVFDDYENK
jgi:hypothetical protein